MWQLADGPGQLIRHLAVLGSHTIHLGANGAEPAPVGALAMFLRLFATQDCVVRLHAPAGDPVEHSIPGRQAWYIAADDVVSVEAAPGRGPGRLYVNEFG